MLVDRLGIFVSTPTLILEQCPIPLPALGRRRGNFGFGFLLRYDVIEKVEQIFEIFQFSVIFLAEAFKLARILVADRRVEFCQGILRNCFTWWSTLRPFRQRTPLRRSSFAYRLHVINQEFQRLDLVFIHDIREMELA